MSKHTQKNTGIKDIGINPGQYLARCPYIPVADRNNPNARILITDSEKRRAWMVNNKGIIIKRFKTENMTQEQFDKFTQWLTSPGQ